MSGRLSKILFPQRLTGLIRRRFTPPAVLDLRCVTDDPLYADYRHPQQDFVVNVPLARCRALRHAGWPCGTGAAHPFVQTLLDHAAGRHVGYAGSAMQRYYDGWQPASAIESLGLQGEAMSDAMVGLGPLEAVSPWWPDTGGGLPAAAAAHLCRRTRTENRENGADMGCEDGIILFGPVSPRKGQLEYDRLVRVWHSIASGGYRRSNAWQGDVTGTLLVRADGPAGTSDAVVMIGAGQHRVAALAAALTPELAPAPAASGLTEGRTGPDAVIPVRFTRTLSPRVIRREDAASWPYVRNGWFTADQARRVFDRIHDGPPLGPSGA